MVTPRALWPRPRPLAPPQPSGPSLSPLGPALRTSSQGGWWPQGTRAELLPAGQDPVPEPGPTAPSLMPRLVGVWGAQAQSSLGRKARRGQVLCPLPSSLTSTGAGPGGQKGHRSSTQGQAVSQ